MTPDATEEIRLDGVLVAVAWGEAGEVTEVALNTFDENEYRIDPESSRDHHLTDLLRKHVRLTVVLRGGRAVVRGVELRGPLGTNASPSSAPGGLGSDRA